MTAAQVTATGGGFRPARADAGIAGQLELAVARTGRRTSPVRTRHRGVLRLLRPLYLDDSGQLTYVIVNPGGAYFGEHYRITVELEPEAQLLLAGQGATRIYRTPREPAQQEMRFTLRSGSRLEYVPEQTIAYRDADYRQMTTVEAAPDAQGFFGEIVTPGWDPDGDRFTYARMHLRFEVVAEPGGRPVCIDNMLLQPSAIGDAIEAVGYLEGMSHVGSALVLGPHLTDAHVARVREAVGDLHLDKVGVASGSRYGVSWLLVRALAASTDELRAMIGAVNELDRAATTGQGRLDLRRY